MVDFTSVLNKKAVEAEKPKPQPSGTYMSVIQGMPGQREVKTKDGDRAVLAFKVKMLAPQVVDNQEYFDEYPTQVSDWMPFSHDVWVDGEQGEWQLRQFLENVLGIDPGTSDNPKTFGEMIAESPGRQLIATLVHEPYMSRDNTPEVACRIRGVAAV